MPIKWEDSEDLRRPIVLREIKGPREPEKRRILPALQC